MVMHAARCLLPALVALLGAGCATPPAPSAQQPAAAPMLVDSAWLAANRDRVVLVDMQTKREQYEKAHIPGARYANVEEFRNADKDLAATDVLAARLGALGIDAETHVVAYDDMQGRNASWLWFTLDQLGHRRVSLLQGDPKALQTEAGPGTRPQPRRYVPRATPRSLVDTAYVQARVGKALMLDARPPEQYTGAKPKKGMRGGHVEGARNVPYLAFVGPDGGYLDVAEARANLEKIAGRAPAADEEIVLFCNTYQEASAVHFHLARMGFTNLRAYDGSMMEWEKRGLPLRAGEQP